MKTFILLLISIVLTGCSSPETIETPDLNPFIATNKTVIGYSQFEKAIEDFKNMASQIDKDSFYEDIIFLNTETTQQIKWIDVSPLQKDMFKLLTVQMLEEQIDSLIKAWTDEVVSANTQERKNKILLFVLELNDSRKMIAIKYENMMNDIFKRRSNEISKEEIDEYRQKVISKHDSKKLIER